VPESVGGVLEVRRACNAYNDRQARIPGILLFLPPPPHIQIERGIRGHNEVGK
jgi:hypothetical protein